MSDESLPSAAAARIDALCLDFEADLKAGRRPDIESYVQRADAVDRDWLRRELQHISGDFERSSAEPREAAVDAPSSQAITTDLVRTTPSNTAHPSQPRQTGSYPPADVQVAKLRPATPKAVARYEIRGLLGEGGFGLVYRGYDPQLRRDVAIKVPRRPRKGSSAQTEAYLAEARRVAQLDHSGIVPVYDAGRTADGQCFVVSKFVAGSDLAKWMDGRRPEARSAAEIIAQVAEALHHAHRQGLVHRDIKPANILIDESGRPLVTDFGLALDDNSFGQGAQFCGTPAYMSPEQAAGRSDRVDARSDIYSLGIVFYELLTGRRPYRSAASADLIDEIASDEIRPPRQFDHTIPAELERICLKAVARRIGDRYTTAHDLADDLRRFLNGGCREDGQEPPVEAAGGFARSGWGKVGVGLVASLSAACGLALAAYVLFAEKPVARFETLDLDVVRVRESRALEEPQDTYSLVADGQNSEGLPDARLAPDEAFRLVGRFATPCFSRLFWFDTRGRWTPAEAPPKEQEEFAYPVAKTMVHVDPADPPGTHLLLIIAGRKPVDRQLTEKMSIGPPPAVGRLRFWSNSKRATSRGPGREVTTIDSYLSSLAQQLPEDQMIVAALFLPVEP